MGPLMEARDTGLWEIWRSDTPGIPGSSIPWPAISNYVGGGVFPVGRGADRVAKEVQICRLVYPHNDVVSSQIC